MMQFAQIEKNNYIYTKFYKVKNMAVDKKNIKPILDGQLGSEVAQNMKDNFDYLADEINKNEAKLNGVKIVIKQE